MKLLDRQILRSLLVNYGIALAVMMSLYVVLDLFINIDEFTESNQAFSAVTARMLSYYGAHVFLYFSQLSAVITLFACLATLAQMRRANEFTAILASGVSLYRVGAVSVAFALGTSVLWCLNTELVIPRLAHLLARSHDDAEGRGSRGVWLVNDGPSTLLSAFKFVPADQCMGNVLIVHRNAHGMVESLVEADSAVWDDTIGHPPKGGWKLQRGRQKRRVVDDASTSSRPAVRETPIAMYQSSLSPAVLEARQTEQWLAYSSLSQLAKLSEREPVLADRVRQTKHRRLVAPLVHLLMMLLGLPFILCREPGRIVDDAVKCLAVCGLCYLLACLGGSVVNTSVFSAWLPVIVFTPVAGLLIYRIRT